MKFARIAIFLSVALVLSGIFYLSIYFNLSKNTAIAPGFGTENAPHALPNISLSEAEKAKLIAKDPEVYEYYSFDNEGLNIYASAQDKANFKAECKIFYEEFEIFNTLFKNADIESLKIIYEKKGTQKLNLKQYEGYLPVNEKKMGALPLSGVKIALDPGHLGGDMETAMMEGKFIRIKNADGTITEFNEGNIALKTAKILAKKLEAQGARVMLTREKQGISAFDMSYEAWLQSSFDFALEEALKNEALSEADYQKLKHKRNKKEIHDLLFRRLDIEERARKINAFRPDLCLVIHYNVDEENYLNRDRENQLLNATEANYSMVFMPGSFLKNELQRKEERIELMRLLMTNDLALSLRFNSIIMNELEDNINVLPISPDSKMGYIRNASVFTGHDGVFARNLALTRMVHAPICYTEPLCQDNIEEYPRLANGSRLEEVAEAYYLGIMKFFEAHLL